ncbi:SipW-dependent-type signal peptide-containing protein [Gordonia westfalica]
MTNNQTPTSAPLTDEERNRKSRKRKAILASGAVLGVGAVVTLAAWNDTVFGAGTFGIGDTAWNVQGSTSGVEGSYAEYATNTTSGPIAFNVDLNVDPAHLMPGQTAKGKFWLKETHNKMPADIVIQPAANAGNTLGQALLVTIKEGSTTLLSNSPLSATGAAATAAKFTIPKGGTKVVDFEVTLPANANPSAITDTSVTALWEMRAQSVG